MEARALYEGLLAEMEGSVWAGHVRSALQADELAHGVRPGIVLLAAQLAAVMETRESRELLSRQIYRHTEIALAKLAEIWEDEEMATEQTGSPISPMSTALDALAHLDSVSIVARAVCEQHQRSNSPAAPDSLARSPWPPAHTALPYALSLPPLVFNFISLPPPAG